MMQEEGDDIELTYKNGGCAKENLSDEDDYLSNDKDSLGGIYSLLYYQARIKSLKEVSQVD